MLCWGNVDAGAALIDRHPDTRFIIDHLAIMQPRTPPAPPQPWADLPKVLDLPARRSTSRSATRTTRGRSSTSTR
jgi:predicted TIM-barrel fold metal-dependent hydrolase